MLTRIVYISRKKETIFNNNQRVISATNSSSMPKKINNKKVMPNNKDIRVYLCQGKIENKVQGDQTNFLHDKTQQFFKSASENDGNKTKTNIQKQMKMTDSRLKWHIPVEKLGIFNYEPEDPESFIQKLKEFDEKSGSSKKEQDSEKKQTKGQNKKIKKNKKFGKREMLLQKNQVLDSFLCKKKLDQRVSQKKVNQSIIQEEIQFENSSQKLNQLNQ